MRLMNKNKQLMYYSLQNDQTPVYETDENGNIIYYTDYDGNKIPLETGDKTIGYGKPVAFKANISMSGGEAEAKEYGLSVADYDAVIVADVNRFPVALGAKIWHKSKPGYKDAEETVTDENTADYSVVKVSESINVVKYILKAVVK